MKCSYHTHTRWCNHADGEMEEYLLEAIKAHYDVYALCDHYPLITIYGRRMNPKDLPLYFKEVERLESKYKDKIKTICAFEAEYFPDKMEEYKRIKDEYNVELWILGQHEQADHHGSYYNLKIDKKEALKRYTDDVIKGLETGFFKVLAHPDLMMRHFEVADEEVFDSMRRIFKKIDELGLIAEVNANGLRGSKNYPSKEIWQIAKDEFPNMKVIISSDAHSPEFVDDSYVKDAYKFARDLGLNVLDSIESEEE